MEHPSKIIIIYEFGEANDIRTRVNGECSVVSLIITQIIDILIIDVEILAIASQDICDVVTHLFVPLG